MIDKVTYILGAGFSAPLGLPVMSDFLIKSRDLYFSDSISYKHFSAVFDTIEQLSVSKNYYNTDLFNIEEILSIIEMGTFLEGKKLKKVFSQYISDVITYYTPKFKPRPGSMPGNWYDFIFGGDTIQEHYCYFVANIFGLEFWRTETSDYQERRVNHNCRPNTDKKTKYAILTLNYDLVLENVCTFIKENYNLEAEVEFNRNEELGDWSSPPLAKLHGSVDIDLIVPPTWAKGANSKIPPMWKNAYQILKDSNHIRFIGYSLPIADAYVKYLLKSAVVNAPHLKSIDVICLDKNNSVKNRYDEFIEFSYYRFANTDVAKYMQSIRSENLKHKPQQYVGQNHIFSMNVLETVHEQFMLAHQ